MKQKPRKSGKYFECDTCQHCVEMVVLGCHRCIKKFTPLLTQGQKEKILKIIG